LFRQIFLKYVPKANPSNDMVVLTAATVAMAPMEFTGLPGQARLSIAKTTGSIQTRAAPNRFENSRNQKAKTAAK